MSRHQLARAVAGATGESLRTVRRLGFGPLHASPIVLEPEDLVLAVNCPFCGRPALLATAPGAQGSLSGCDPCDIEFDYMQDDVYAVGLRALGRAVPAA